MSRRQPIGVFDSGIGGLTVLKAMSRRMPMEDLLYFGDTAHVPYGTKSPEAVTRYSVEIARYLEQKGIKLLVVACNTASAVALPAIRRAIKVPVLGVIEPGAGAAAQATRPGGAIGIIATEGTIASGAYTRAIKSRMPRAKVVAQACPLFVPLVEEGWWAHEATTAAARQYLKPLKKAKVDTLILGCTHYPLLKGTIGKIMGKKVELIDSAEQTAIEAERILDDKELSSRAGSGRRAYISSDDPARFRRAARRLLGVSVPRVTLHRFDS